MRSHIALALENWIPYKLLIEEEQVFCNWLFIGDLPFSEPFFDETILKCKSRTSSLKQLKCVSRLDMLLFWSEHIEAIQPSAFIFHVSRCGSTLVSQLLSLSRHNVVLSEVPFFDELLRKRIPCTDEKHHELLKAAIHFYAAKRNNDQHYTFIKTDSWHVLFYRQLRKLYPTIPFILLYRRPDEVIRSQQKRRGMQAVPRLIEPELFGFANEDIQNISLNEYMARVLEKYFQAFLNILDRDPLAIPINYNEGALMMVQKVMAATGGSISKEEMDAIKQRANYHAKYPEQVFSEDPVLTAVPSYCLKAFELYEELETIRKGVVPSRYQVDR